MEVKFYHIQTYTCYCGETIDHFFKGTEKEMEQYAESCVEDDAMEWWAEVASLKDWYSKLQAMKSPYITTEGFAIQFKSHEYYIEEQTIL